MRETESSLILSLIFFFFFFVYALEFFPSIFYFFIPKFSFFFVHVLRWNCIFRLFISSIDSFLYEILCPPPDTFVNFLRLFYLLLSLLLSLRLVFVIFQTLFISLDIISIGPPFSLSYTATWHSLSLSLVETWWKIFALLFVYLQLHVVCAYTTCILLWLSGYFFSLLSTKNIQMFKRWLSWVSNRIWI